MPFQASATSSSSIQWCAAPGWVRRPCPAQEPRCAGTHHRATPSQAVSQDTWQKSDMHKRDLGLHCDLHPTNLHVDMHSAELVQLL